MHESIEAFSGKHRFLSNFYPSRLQYEGISYPRVEHAYQAAKTMDIKQRQEIAKAATPTIAKRMGQKVKLRADWDGIKLKVMYQLVSAKFYSNSSLEARLLATGNAKLVEGNWWCDTFWGVWGGVGENHLGKILMKVREELRNG